ncbi:thiosulfate sulfurtransferase GlpE [Billgrantia endophytica]|uniref:Thiosulfate sulfurtransferase n=1 Tax=Billgrantia endophytica TaxID=2033802 RepID=A0A2N7U003_9GAMM|nr:thiosulfate sulfurtransferase GlpE [Halomonas endophytica]PMR73764.1 thiosulfate sulfurtransferase [Halomonas endophytica]
MNDVKRISVEDAEALLDRKENVMLLDMRDAQAYCQGHDPRAIHLSDFILRSLLKYTPRHVHVIINCHQGDASQDMVRQFSDCGFSNCYSLDGGYQAWKNRDSGPASTGQKPHHSLAQRANAVA